MPTINQLATLNSVTSADKLIVYSNDNGDARKASINTVREFMESSFVDVEAQTITLSNYLKVTTKTVANLPSVSVAGAGARAAVTDATQTLTAGIGTIVSGGGANVVPVFCDGTNWRIG
jgi:hypothetical protein